MGVPKFFRWLSERYPKINQPIHAPPDPNTLQQYFPSSSSSSPRPLPTHPHPHHVVHGDDQTNESGSEDKAGDQVSEYEYSQVKTQKKALEQDHRVYIQKNSLVPEFDRLYLDMNGIIHCSSHNNASDDNATVDPDTHLELDLGDFQSRSQRDDGTVVISEAEIFRNVCYYVDRVVSDIAKPKELVYMAIDGVAPRAKMNQQRSRRYRSGKEREIESTFYGAHLLAQKKQKLQQEQQQQNVDVLEQDQYWDIQGVGGLENLDNINGAIPTGGSAGSGSATASERLSSNSTVNMTNDGSEGPLQEVEPGRYIGTFETTPVEIENTTTPFDLDYDQFLEYIKNKDSSHVGDNEEETMAFHSNTITPGTPFFERCTQHLKHFIKRKLHTDPRWKDLTIIFSGPDVPGEGEHKIMDFIRRQKVREDYDPNTTHCLFGQDGDLIMLGLATHEPHFVLLREEVVFDQSRKREQQKLMEARAKMHRDKVSGGSGTNDVIGVASEKVTASIDSYIHNSNFELLHMPILRDYLAYEFETKEVLPNSPFELEKTIDDFVFMTFIVGNDFLPHMPAIDIADEAFDLLFYTYKRNRWRWLKEEKDKNDIHPYLTNSGEIVSGSRLENFFTELGKHEDPYYDNKKRAEWAELKRLRKSDKKAGRESSIPSDDILAAKEEWDRTNYMEMLKSIRDSTPQVINGFKPVLSSKDFFSDFGKDARSMNSMDKSNKEYTFQPDANDGLEEDFLNRMGKLFRNSLSPVGEGGPQGTSSNFATDDEIAELDRHVEDLKGRYYYEKFKISPLDAEKHIALRKSYITGLVWNLQYYYKGCVDWDWFYPYHYGPRLSDLRDIDNMLKEIAFEEPGEPLKPFEQLMACLPPSSAELLPKPYQWLMKSSKSPIIDFYPNSFTIDMNGKRWPWEAVVLLPFIDSERLISSSRTMVPEAVLSESERRRNQFGEALVYNYDEAVMHDVPALNDRLNFGSISKCNASEAKVSATPWKDDHLAEKALLRPELLPGTILPYPGFPTLRDAPVHGLTRRKLGINIFGMRSRYRTAVLQLDRDIPMITSAESIAEKFIGTTLYFRYPFLQEGFVTAVSDAEVTVRGKEPPRKWSQKESQTWSLKNDTIKRQYETGEGVTGSGGWNIPDSEVTLSVRPLKEIQMLPDGTKVKVYARLEVEVPIVAAIWSPSKPDPRLINIPAKLEKNPFRFGSQPASQSLSQKNGRILAIRKNRSSTISSTLGASTSKMLPDFSSTIASPKTNILPPSSMKSNTFSTVAGSHFYPVRAHNIDVGNAYPIRTSIRKIPRGRMSSRGILTVATIVSACLAKGSATNFESSISKAHTTTLPSLKKHEASWSENMESDILRQEQTEPIKAPPLEYAHGTTTLSFIFDGGIIAAVDSRASIGNFVGSKTTQKVLPINSRMLGTMAGGAADCSFWIRKLQAESRRYEISEGTDISVSKVSRMLADYLYANRHLDLSVGTMIMGFDELGPNIYYVDNRGTRIKGDMFSVGSGSTFALGVLDTERRLNMTEQEAIALGIKAIRHATFRDAFSGGYIAVYVINRDGWKKVFSEDLALTKRNFKK